MKFETYVWLCDLDDVVKETNKALLVSVGTTRSGLPIEMFIPKSVVVLKEAKVTTGMIVHMYVPLYIAKNKGIGWHIDDNSLPDGYVKYSDNYSNSYKQCDNNCNTCHCDKTTGSSHVSNKGTTINNYIDPDDYGYNWPDEEF